MPDWVKKVLDGIKKGLNWIKNLFKKKKEELPTDLVKFKEATFDPQIKAFFESNPETHIVFLNADFGMGKTKFVKDVLKIDEKYIFSPWLNSSGNVLETIYYQLAGKNVKFVTWIYLLLAFTFLLLTSWISSDNFNIHLGNLIFVKNYNNLIFECKIGYIIAFCVSLCAFIIYMLEYDYIILKILKKVDTPVMNNMLVKKIEKNIENGKCIVIEDIDRCNDIENKDKDRCNNIENILISLNKLSKIIGNKKKYILITGDYKRTQEIIGRERFFKVINRVIDFAPTSDRINTILKEFNIADSDIEVEEIRKFMLDNGISIREFIQFAKLNKNTNTSDVLYLFVSHFTTNKIYGRLNKKIKKFYMGYTTPDCLNDVEYYYQKNDEPFYSTKNKIMWDKELLKKMRKDRDLDLYVSYIFCNFVEGVENIDSIINKYANSEANGVDITIDSSYGIFSFYDLQKSIEKFLLSKFEVDGEMHRRCYLTGVPNLEYIFKNNPKKDKISVEEYCYVIFTTFMYMYEADIQRNYKNIFKNINKVYPKLFKHYSMINGLIITR